jgi:hypothetical protein
MAFHECERFLARELCLTRFKLKQVLMHRYDVESMDAKTMQDESRKESYGWIKE